MSDTPGDLERMVRQRVSSPWLERALSANDDPGSIAFRAVYAAAARRLGATATERVTAPALLAASARAHWVLVDWVRAALLARALGFAAADRQVPLLRALHDGGELGEQESLLRTLSLLPAPERFVDVAVSACRTNTQRVFEAIACDNPYPCLHFPETGWNQMVLKAIFLGLPVRRIEGLATRITPELRRMAGAYASERRAAGRPVPDDAGHIARGAAP